MQIEEIKAELEKRGWTYKVFAEKLHIAENSVAQMMCGRNKIKPQLMGHIKLLFSAPEMAVLVYKINLTEKQVEDLTAGEQFPATEEGQRRKEEALKMVLRHNAEKLAAFRKGGRYDEMLQQIYDVIDANRAAKEAAEKEQNGGGET